MIVTSAMSGTLVRWYVPSASSVVAISLSTEFLAPGTVTTPASGPLPRTTMRRRRWEAARRARERPDRAGSWPTSMLRSVEPGGRIVTRRWPDDPAHRSLVEHPRDDVLLEQPEPGVARTRRHLIRPRGGAAFTQAQGPFTAYRRTVVADGDELVESTEFGVTIPWFGWLFRWPVRGVLARRISAQGLVGAARPARPDAAPGARPARRRVDERGVRQHAVHPDGQLRRRRFRRRQHRCRHRRRVRPRRHRHRPSGRRDRRPHRATPGDRVGRLARSAAVGARRDRPDVRRPRRHPDAGAPDGHRPRLPGRRRRRRGDADATAGPTRSASWRWRPASGRASR